MINWNEPIRFRDPTRKWPVRFLSFIQNAGKDAQALCGYVPDGQTQEMILVVSLDGKKNSNGSITDWDVVQGPRIAKRFMNVYEGPQGLYPGKLFPNYSDCVRAAKENTNRLVKCVELELEL